MKPHAAKALGTALGVVAGMLIIDWFLDERSSPTRIEVIFWGVFAFEFFNSKLNEILRD